MASLTTTTTNNNNKAQVRSQRRLLFEGFNMPAESLNSARRSASMMTSTPEPRLNDDENLNLLPLNDPPATTESCLLQLQNARQMLHTMSQTNGADPPALLDDQIPRPDLFSDTNPELAYYKSSLESERNRRKQLQTLVDTQQQRLTETESELIQLRANDQKKTLCMKQLEQMIPNVVDEWKQKETDYKSKLNQLSQQVKQLEQINREKVHQEKVKFDEEINEKNSTIERLTKETERTKQEQENLQTKLKQQEQRIQQLIKEAEQAKQRHSAIEAELRADGKAAENQTKEIQNELERKQQDIEQILREQQKFHSEHQSKVRQLENEVDEQRRETNVLKMELELRETKHRAQTESLKIQILREAETKIGQRLEEQHLKHVQIENELNELHRRKLSDLEEKYEQILTNERQDNEGRIQTLLKKIELMKNDLERIQTTTMAERQDLARKLQDVFESALFKGSTRSTFASSDASPPSMEISQMKLSSRTQPSDTQVKTERPPELFHPEPTNLSAIRSLSSRIDSLVDQTNRVANGFEIPTRSTFSFQPETNTDWTDSNSNRFIPSSQPHSALHSPFYRSTPIDSMQEWIQPATASTQMLTSRSQSADPSTTGLFSTYSSQTVQQPTPSFSFDGNFNNNQFRSASSLGINLFEHQKQQNVQSTMSKDSIERPNDEPTSTTNEALSRYVKLLLERSPAEEKSSHSHPLAKTNRSLHDIRLSIEQLNFAERDSRGLIDDLAQPMANESHSSRVTSPHQHQTKSQTSKQNLGRIKKRLDYDSHPQKQDNANELFDRLSQPKTRIKKDKPKATQPTSQPSTGTQNAWK